MRDEPGDRYQRESKYQRGRMPGGTLDWRSRPDPYKDYPGSMETRLPEPKATAPVSLDGALKSRRSIRDFADDPLSLERLSYLLWASSGIQRVEQGYEYRVAPSAGALYPIETYLVANRIEDLEPGLYHYSARRHALELIRPGELGAQTARGALGQEMCADAAGVFFFTAVFERSKWKYGQRAYRYVYLDAGHMCENLYLAVTAEGLGMCEIGALFDDELNELLGVDGVEESVMVIAAVGFY